MILLLKINRCFSGELDSLIRLSVILKEDTLKADVLNKIAFDCRNNDPELSISYGQNALELSEKLGYPKGIGEGYLAMGAGKINLGRHEEALNYLNHALKSFRFEKGKAVVEKKDGFIEMYTADYL